MLKKMVLLIVATSFLFIVAIPVQSYSHNQSIQPQVQIGGS